MPMSADSSSIVLKDFHKNDTFLGGDLVVLRIIDKTYYKLYV